SRSPRRPEAVDRRRAAAGREGRTSAPRTRGFHRRRPRQASAAGDGGSRPRRTCTCDAYRGKNGERLIGVKQCHEPNGLDTKNTKNTTNTKKRTGRHCFVFLRVPRVPGVLRARS